jgi:hypothetical protein
MGLLDREGDCYRTSAISRACLLPGSPYCQQNTLRFQRRLAGLWSRLSGILRDGPVIYYRALMFRDVIIPSMAETCRCGTLQQVTSAVADLTEFPSARRLLDLGGGHGLYSIAFCNKNPLLEAVVFDLPPVTDVTQDFISRYRADRVTVQPGDFFTDPLGTGYDIVFSSSNPGGKVPSLIPKIAAALNDGGLYINKQALDDSQQDPFLNLEWNLWTFSGMQKQPARYRFSDSVPFADYNRMLVEHGFVVRDVIPVDPQSAMTVAQKVAR